VELSFYGGVLAMTRLLIMLLATVFGVSLARYRMLHRKESEEMKEKAASIKSQGWYLAVYILVFAFPVVATKVVRIFGCHEIDGVK
jgi:hypothetical protein